MLGWPKRCKLAHTFPWEYDYKRLKLAQLLGHLGLSLAPGYLLEVGRGADVDEQALAPRHAGEKDAKLPLVHPLFHTELNWH